MKDSSLVVVVALEVVTPAVFDERRGVNK
jgi:hypothetical protein